MRKTLNISIPEAIYEKVKRESEMKKQSMSSYICNALASYEPKSTINQDPSEDIASDSIAIRLHGAAATQLRTRAEQLGVTPTGYVRDIALYHNLRPVEIEHSIGRELLMAFNDYNMDIKYLISCFEEASSPEDLEIIRQSAESDTTALAKLVVKYQKKITKEIALLERRLRKGNKNGH